MELHSIHGAHPQKIRAFVECPESRQTELGLLDEEIGTLRADNKSLRTINRILEREKKELEAEVETLRAEAKGENDPLP